MTSSIHTTVNFLECVLLKYNTDSGCYFHMYFIKQNTVTFFDKIINTHIKNFTVVCILYVMISYVYFKERVTYIYNNPLASIM